MLEQRTAICRVYRSKLKLRAESWYSTRIQRSLGTLADINQAWIGAFGSLLDFAG